jgi:hypothetical protein
MLQLRRDAACLQHLPRKTTSAYGKYAYGGHPTPRIHEISLRFEKIFVKNAA